MVPIQVLAEGLAAIPRSEFTHHRVLEFLRANRVAPASLAPYTYFCPDHYTRNLIYRCDLFELIAICWEIGQRSAIHNHRDQSCWMAMAYGKVMVHNFKLLHKDPATGFCELEPSTQFVIDVDNPGQVDPAEPIHQVINATSFRSRAVTLHVYSLPFDTCEVYDLKTKHYEDVRLVNTSEFGVLKTPQRIEKVAL